MGFDIRPGMTLWNNTTARYKKEYHIYAAKMEQRKFENDRKMIEKERIEKVKRSIGPSKNASLEEKKWFSWMS